MILETDPDHGAGMIVCTCLNNVRPVAFQRHQRLFGRPDDGNVSRFVLVRVGENHDHQIASIGLRFAPFLLP